MDILVGVRPGGRNSFAVTALYYTGHLPGHLIVTKVCSSVQEVLHTILGVTGEWGELTAGAIDAPLTWSPNPRGWRQADHDLKKRLPSWTPKNWVRSPNAMPGSVAIQGPALTWALAYEAKRSDMPPHDIYETNARASLACLARDMRTAILNYRKKDVAKKTRAKHVAKLIERFVDAGVVTFEVDRPQSAEELDAMVCAITAMGIAFPDTGLVTHLLPGGDIRPVGRRQLAILDALP